jgi:lipoprotein-anchoring transpeptidase ErfK/SrfK
MILVGGLVVAAACGKGDDHGRAERVATAPTPPDTTTATVYGNPRERLTPEQIEQARRDTAWRRTVPFDTVAQPDTSTDPERWEQISPESVNEGTPHVPLHGDVAGPSVLRVQVALDRALFSPGVIDGKWGKNTEEAVYWLQDREGLRRTGRVDRATYERLMRLAGDAPWVSSHSLTADDVAGPFVRIPDDIYEEAKLDCSCYESLGEKLAERFHTTRGLLEQLNPGVDLDGLQAGQTLQVLDVRSDGASSDARVAQLRISDEGHYVHAVDSQGKVLFHFPSTLGSSYAPSPEGRFRVTAIHWDPKWYYQPDLLTGVPDWKEPATIPPGPNNAVGVVWMQLSREHYGIHGTSAPETIGYATSHGCVRLTNWDARFLARRIQPGIEVHFLDVHSVGGTE